MAGVLKRQVLYYSILIFLTRESHSPSHALSPSSSSSLLSTSALYLLLLLSIILLHLPHPSPLGGAMQRSKQTRWKQAPQPPH